MYYKYETHLHTQEGSACAHNSGEEMAYAAKEAGYTGIIVTNHNWGGNTAVNRNLPWDEFVEEFYKGYEHAKRAGDAIGLDVFYGWESGFHGTEFLIYGLDKEWMLAHPKIWSASIEEQYKMVKKAGGMVIHAHPFREERYIPQVRLFPEYVDGVEVINAAHSNSKSKGHYNPEFNEKAYQYATEHHLFMTAGSDIHTINMLGGGMLFERRLADIHDFIQAVKNHECVALTDGEHEIKLK